MMMERGKKKKKVPGLPTNTREAVTDERFAQVLRNPVYRPVPKKEKKIEIDGRFQGMFNDEKFKLKYKVDKRGRPIATATEEDMKRYYNVEETGEEKEEDDEETTSDEEIEGDVKEEEMRRKVGKQKIDPVTREKLRSEEVDYARGEADFEDSSSSEEDTESEEEEGEENLEHDWGELDKDAERTEASTRRLALCNMDWDRVRAVDLMVLLSSFLPPGGVIREVAIYPSEFGKERMAEEEREGPRELRGDGSEVKVKTEVDSDEEEDSEVDEEDDEEGEGTQYHREKLRQYQLNRLKYFYAVATFDSPATADKVYAECDGMEYESSAAKVDLRFIPEEVSFEEDSPREVCREMPDGQKYRPRFFTTTALQQVKVDLTWDETDPLRKELTEKIFDPKEKVEDDDIRAYLATSSEEEEEEEEIKKEEESEEETEGGKKGKKQDAISKYKALLEGIEEGEKKKKEKEVEMEITWGVGLRESTEKLVKKKLAEEENKKRTPWEEMLDKRKEKRQQRKKEKKEETEEQPFSDDEVDVDMDDEFFKSEMRDNAVFKGVGGKKKQKKEKEVEGEATGVKTNAELELLLMEDEEEAGKRHFSLKKILEEETDSKSKKKRKWKKNKKREAEGTGEGKEVKDDFEIDVGDQRFSALFNSHHFNVDPSDPNFKKTRAMERIIQEKQKRRGDKTGDVGGDGKNREAETGEKKRRLEVDDRKVKKAELSHLVKSVKRNTENLKMIETQKKLKKRNKFKIK